MTAPTLRQRITAVAAVTAAGAVVVLVIAFNLVLRGSLGHDLDARLRTTAAAVATTTTIRDGHVVVRESPDDEAVDRGVWIYEGRRAVVRAPDGPQLDREADALAGVGERVVTVGDNGARLYAAPLRARGVQVGTVVTTAALGPYDRTTDLALAGSAIFGLVMFLATTGLTWVATGRALGPVREMTRTAASWSTGAPERRFGTGPRPDELGELAATFDGLLDRVTASLRHEQRLTAEISHELRTPLARITTQIELLQRRERDPVERAEALRAVHADAEELHAILETLLRAARDEGSGERGRSDLAAVLTGVGETWGERFAERGAELRVAGTEESVAIGVDAAVVERILAPLLANAQAHGGPGVTLEGGTTTAGRVVLRLSDDGPGVSAQDSERMFAPGEVGQGSRGAGLGLPLARRLARGAGGDVVLRPGGAGASFEVLLPRLRSDRTESGVLPA